MNRKFFKMLAAGGICLLMALSASAFIVFGDRTSGHETTVDAAISTTTLAGTPIKSDASINGAGGNLTVTEADTKGVARVQYTQMPTNKPTADENSTANSITIPVTGWTDTEFPHANPAWTNDTKNPVVFIKYSGIDSSKFNMFVGYSDNSPLNFIGAGNNWSTAAGQNSAGETYIKAYYRNVTGFLNPEKAHLFDKIVIAFDTDQAAGATVTARDIKIGGVLFGLGSDTPRFPTDIVDPSADVTQITNDNAADQYTLNVNSGAMRVTNKQAKNNGRLKLPVSDWKTNYGVFGIGFQSNTNNSGTTGENAVRHFVRVYAAENPTDEFADAILLDNYNPTRGILNTNNAVLNMYFDLPVTFTKLSHFYIEIDPNVADSFYGGYPVENRSGRVTISNAVFQSRFSQGAMTSMFPNTTTTTEGYKQIKYNVPAGDDYLEVFFPITGWNPSYDTLFLDMNFDTPGVLFGLIVYKTTTDITVRSHWGDAGHIGAAGDYVFCVTNLASSGAGNVTGVMMYFDPRKQNSAVQPAPGTPVTVLFRSWAVQRSGEKITPVNTAVNKTVDYNGEPHTLTPIQPDGQELTYNVLYSTTANGTYTATAPTNAGTYYVRHTFPGSLTHNPVTYSSSNYTAQLIINRIANPTAPVAGDVSFDWTKGLMNFENTVQVNTANDFESATAITSGSAFTEGQQYYVRLAQTTNYLPTDPISITVPTRTDVVITANVAQSKTSTGLGISPDATADKAVTFIYEYRENGTSDEFTEGLPSEVGVWEVNVISVGTQEFRSATKTVVLTIALGKYATPTILNLEIDYATEKLNFTSNYLVSKSQTDFTGANLVTTGQTVLFGQTLYVKRIADANGTESDVAQITMPSRPAAPEVTVDFVNENTSVVIPATWEYEDSEDAGVWITGTGEKVSIAPSSTLRFRIKASASAFTSQLATLTVPARPATPAATALSTDNRTVTHNSIAILNGNAAWEYSLDRETWQTSPSFTGLTAATAYTVYVRVKATSSAYASANRSASITTLAYTAATGVTLNKTTTTITVGGNETLVPTVAPAGATVKTITWSTSNENIATVDSTGKVTAVAAGSVTITATTVDGSFTATCAVTVSAATTAVTGVTLNKTTTTLTVGGNETLTATIAPATATNKNVTWSTSDESIATVDANGKVTAVAAGTVTIKVTSVDGSFEASCEVTVTAQTQTEEPKGCGSTVSLNGTLAVPMTMLFVMIGFVVIIYFRKKKSY